MRLLTHSLLLCVCLALGACAGLRGGEAENANNAQGQPVFAAQQTASSASLAATSVPSPAPLYEASAEDRANPPVLQRLLNFFRPREAAASSDVRAQLQALAGSDEPYRIGAADVLDIDIDSDVNDQASQPDIRVQNSVTAQGVLDLGELGAYRVQGLSPTQAQRVLRSALSASFGQEPEVSVRVARYRSQSVRLQGQVYAPGDYYIDAVPMSLAEAITRAGGLLEAADLNRIELQRQGKTLHLNLHELYKLGLRPEGIRLRNGDVLNFQTQPSLAGSIGAKP